MRIKKMILWDMKVQQKSGIYLLYAILSGIYFIVLFALPELWRINTATILIFSDPGAMGLFFMGAIVLLEKSQKVPCALSVSPILPGEYIVSKIISLSIISVLVALILSIAAGVENIILILIGTAISSVIFTLMGVIVATKISSLNQFIIGTVPFEIITFVPAIFYLFGDGPKWFKYYPPNVCMDMISGKTPSLIGLFLVFILIIILYIISCKLVSKMFGSLGGVKI